MDRRNIIASGMESVCVECKTERTCRVCNSQIFICIFIDGSVKFIAWNIGGEKNRKKIDRRYCGQGGINDDWTVYGCCVRHASVKGKKRQPVTSRYIRFDLLLLRAKGISFSIIRERNDETPTTFFKGGTNAPPRHGIRNSLFFSSLSLSLSPSSLAIHP